MKIKLLQITAALGFFFMLGTANAQMVPNGDFEQPLSGGVLPGWDALSGSIVQRTELGITISGELKHIKSNGGQNFVTVTNNGAAAGVIRTKKFPMSTQAKGVRMQCMYFPNGADGFTVGIVMTKANVDTNMMVSIDTMLNVGARLTGSRFPWQTFTLSIPDTLYQGTPDSAYITFVAGGAPASLLALDDVLFIDYAASTGAVSLLTGAMETYPNPAKNVVNLNYTLNMEANVNIEIYDIQGRLVKSVLNEKQYNGEYSQKVNIEGLNSGMYFFKVQTDNLTESIRFMVD